MNVATQLTGPLTVIWPSAQSEAPLQPEKTEPRAGKAVRTTEVPAEKLSAQSVPQSIPAGWLVTRPEPVTDTVSGKVWRVNVAVMVFGPSATTVQG